MGVRFADLDEYYSPGLELPVRGTVYTVPLPSGELGLWCRRIAQTAGEVGSADTPEEMEAAAERARERVAALPPLPGGEKPFDELMLGGAYAEMLKNAVPDPYIQFCAQTAYWWIVGGEEAARRYWESGGRPEARGPGNRAQRRAARRAAGGTSTAEAAETPSAASSSGTSTPSRSSGRSRGRRSRGRRF
ncbi:hypothetical protein ACFQZ4_24185 [Catellatospora coxensis]|uniref:DUF7426 domain-containing protein n=1 Tax=Catellatospora coxensis TaxID=310354 RepID=A0A8J3PAE3_9ACTN|nr:hypothetical protein Cco03nite_69160 [Catellatospora coxensis]